MSLQQTILVIDDVQEILDLFQLQLSQLGYQNIVLVDNGTKALQVLSEQKIDLVFLDIELPDIDGKTILDKIFQSNENLPVIMCSAHNTVDNVRLTWEKGAKGFLAKPVLLPKLKSLLIRIGMLNE